MWAARCTRMDAMCSTDSHVISLEVVGLAKHTRKKAKCSVYLNKKVTLKFENDSRVSAARL